jgi:hypothetical protein
MPYARLVVAGFGAAAASIGTLAALGSPNDQIVKGLERPALGLLAEFGAPEQLSRRWTR